jgi:hypothetical protein
MDMIFKKMFFQSTVRVRESETLILPPTLEHRHLYIYQNFVHIFSLWSSCDHDAASTTFELNRFKLKRSKLAPSWLQLLVILLFMILVLVLILGFQIS